MARRQGNLIRSENVAEIATALEQLPGRGMTIVQARAVNRTVRGTKTDAARLVRQEIALRDRDVKSRMSTRLARYGRTSGYQDAPSAALIVGSKPVPLARYPFRPSSPPSQADIPISARKPTTVQVLKRQSRKTVQHGFVARMPSGHTGVFIRDGEKRVMSKGASAGKRKQPIRELHGPAPGVYFRRDIMMRRLGRKIMPRLHKNLSHELSYYVRQQFRSMARKGLKL